MSEMQPPPPPPPPPVLPAPAAVAAPPSAVPAPPASPVVEALPAPVPPGRRRPIRAIVVTALVTAVLAVAGTLLATGVLLPDPVLDEGALERDVAAVLTRDFGVPGVSAVDCPAGMTVAPGVTFECTFLASGVESSVGISVLNDLGQYRVGGLVDVDELGEG